MTTETKKKKLTSKELIHLWCNKQIKEDITLGNYSFNKTEMFVRNTRVAFFKTKKLVFIKDFDNVSTYGHGINSHWLSQQFPDNIQVVNLLELPNYITKSRQVEHLQKEFIKNIEGQLNALTWLNEFSNNPKWNSEYFLLSIHLDINIEDYNDLQLIYPKNVWNKFLKSKLQFTHKYKKYIGWGRNDYNELSFKVDLTAKEIFEGALSKQLTDEQKKTVSFKIWRNRFDKLININNVKDTFLHTLKESRKIFDNPELRLNRETNFKLQQDNIDKLRLEIAAKKDLELILKIEESIPKWRNNHINNLYYASNLYYTPYNKHYPILRINKNNEVETSMGAIVTIKDAKKALNVFRKYIDNNTIDKCLIGNFKLETIDKKQFNVLVENKIEQKECNYIKIGCHAIPDIEIYNFLKFYNLNW